MATDTADPREAAKARERQIDDGQFLGGDDFPPGYTGEAQATPDADPNKDADPQKADLDADALDAGTDSDDDAGAEAIQWPEDAKVPKRLRDMTPAEVAKEFTSMQTEFGRQATELGETRATIRELVQSRLMDPEASDDKDDSKISLEDLEKDPDKTIQAAIDKALKPFGEQVQMAQLNARVAELNSKFPGFQETVQSSDFVDWVQGSPYRKAVYKRADAYDFDAAEELLTGFTEVQESQKGDGTAQTAKVRSRATVTGKGGGGTAVKRGKVYRYADIARLYTTDRERYNALYPEFEKAEKEGRVK